MSVKEIRVTERTLQTILLLGWRGYEGVATLCSSSEKRDFNEQFTYSSSCARVCHVRLLPCECVGSVFRESGVCYHEKRINLVLLLLFTSVSF